MYSVSFLLGRLSLKMIENFEKFGKSSVIDMEMVRLIICCSKLKRLKMVYMSMHYIMLTS